MSALFLIPRLAIAQEQSEPRFNYSLRLDAKGYEFKAKFNFSSAHSFVSVVSALHDPASMSRANPGLMQPSELVNQKNSQFDVSSSYDSWTIFNLLKSSSPSGTSLTSALTSALASLFDLRMLAHCREKLDLETPHWERECQFDPRLGNARWFTREKTDRVTCETDSNGFTQCLLSVRGDVRALPLISHKKMNLKAKLKALENWIRLWISIEGFELETNSETNVLELKSRLAKLEREGLESFSSRSQGVDSQAEFQAEGEFLFSTSPTKAKYHQ